MIKCKLYKLDGEMYAIPLDKIAESYFEYAHLMAVNALIFGAMIIMLL